MKSITSVVKNFIACTFFLVSSSAFAQMQIDTYDLTNLPVPGGVCTTPDADFTSGQWQIMSQTTEDGNGGMNFTYRQQLKGVALTDSNGDTYRMSGNTHEGGPLTSVQVNSGGTTIIHDTWNFRITPTKGSGGQTFWLKGRIHVIIDSEGNENEINYHFERVCVE